MKAAGFIAAVGMATGLLAVACARPAAPPAPVHLETTRAGADTRVTLVAAALLSGCARAERPSTDLRVESARIGADTKVTLVAGPGLKINARLKPALELPDGSVLRFDSTQLTSDSAYFAEPPSAMLAGSHLRLEGTLRVSVCAIDEQVCRSVSLEI